MHFSSGVDTTDSGSCATPAAPRPLRLGYFFYFCFSRDRQSSWLSVVRNLPTALGGSLEAVFESGVIERSSRNLWMVARGLRLRYSHKRSGRTAPHPEGRRRPISFSAGPWTRPEGRARRPFPSQDSTSKSALSP